MLNPLIKDLFIQKASPQGKGLNLLINPQDIFSSENLTFPGVTCTYFLSWPESRRARTGEILSCSPPSATTLCPRGQRMRVAGRGAGTGHGPAQTYQTRSCTRSDLSGPNVWTPVSGATVAVAGARTGPAAVAASLLSFSWAD